MWLMSVDVIRRAMCDAVEIRSAARTLFDAGVADLSIEETISLVERWQHHRKCKFLQYLTTFAHQMLNSSSRCSALPPTGR